MNDIIINFNRGVETAFRCIYNEYYTGLYYYINKFHINSADAEDIIAETFIKLWQRRENFSHKKAISAFLYTTVRNACIDFLRSEKRAVNKQADLLVMHQYENPAYFPEEDVKAELVRLILREVENLPRKVKSVFLLSYMEGLKDIEIAEHLGIQHQSVRNHKARALKILRFAIADKNLLSVLSLLLIKV